MAVKRRVDGRQKRDDLVVSHAVDAGRRRSANEDRVFADESRGLFVVADGMGGMRDGAEAADTVIRVVTERLATGSISESDIVAAISDADEAVRAALGEGSAGSTVVVAHASDDEIVLAHAGDSRAVLVSDDSLQVLTADHNLAALYVESGRLTADEARNHPSSSRLTSYVGMGPSMTVEIDRVVLASGDCLVIATDGLPLMLSDDEIVSVVSGADRTAAARALVEATLEAGALDNVGVIVLSRL